MPERLKGFTVRLKEILESLDERLKEEPPETKGEALLILGCLLLGVFLSFSNLFLSSLLIGAAVGLTFERELLQIVTDWSGSKEERRLLRGAVLGGALFFLATILPFGLLALFGAPLLQRLLRGS